MLPEYFRYRGLTSEGTPTIGRFKELGISQYIKKRQMPKILTMFYQWKIY